MMDLEEIRTATGWDGVFQGRDCPVIFARENDLWKINGLAQNDQTYYLNFPEYKSHMISFMIARSGDQEFFQYWCIGERLHRTSGPAFISTTSSEIKQEYYDNGLLHRAQGPAQITMNHPGLTTIHPITQENVGPDYLIREWRRMSMFWFEHGVAPKYPMPFSMDCWDGYEMFRMTNENHPVLEGCGDHPGFYAYRMVSNWGRESDFTEADVQRLRMITANDYKRFYQDGEPTSQECSFLALSWVSGENVFEVEAETAERMRKNLFPYWNIWEGPLFQDAQEEMLAVSEVTVK